MWALLGRHQRHQTSRTLTVHTLFLSLSVTSLSSSLSLSAPIYLIHPLHLLPVSHIDRIVTLRDLPLDLGTYSHILNEKKNFESEKV